ncbi:MAG: hypothetical protein HYY16_09855 [Planctomycetes bacterium]|nr:hypothetical protein [Planctomycetota bacterium]
MSKGPTFDLFVEDAGHEDLIKAMVSRLAGEYSVSALIRPVSARGGHSRVFEELRLYKTLRKGAGGFTLPDVLVVAIDCNCSSFAQTQRRVLEHVDPKEFPGAVFALPDPHVERWHMADPVSFRQVIGATPPTVKKKCERDRYKHLLRETIVGAGQPVAMGGIEFAAELVRAMDLTRASRNVPELGRFIADLRAALVAWSGR